MEISNRKLFSRGMVAIGFAVAVSGVSGDLIAEEVPESTAAIAQQEAAAAGKKDKSLSVQEEQLRRDKFAEQDKKLDDARKMEFEAGNNVFRQVIEELGDSKRNFGDLGKQRHTLFLKELEARKVDQGRDLLRQARRAAADKLYPNAIQLASSADIVSRPENAEADHLDSPLKQEIDEFIEFCRKRMQGDEFRTQTKVDTVVPQREANLEKINRLLAEARTFYNAGRYSEAQIRVEQVYLIDPFQQDAIQMMNDIYKQLYTAGIHRKEADVEGILASGGWQWVEPVFPVNMVAGGTRPAENKTPATQGTLAKMERIIFPRIDFEDMNVLTVIRYLNDRSKAYDPEKEGVSVTAGFTSQQAERLGRVTISLSQIPMSEVIRYICQDTGLKYRIEPDGVLIGPNVDEMQTQYFQVRGDLISSITGDDSAEANMGGAAMGGMPQQGPMPTGPEGGSSENPEMGKAGAGLDSKTFLDTRSTAGKRASVTALALMRYFEERGVPFAEGSSVSYDKRASKLIVRNTLENLQRLDELIRQLDAIQTPLVMIEIKSIEISENDMQELGFEWAMDAVSKDMDPSVNDGQLNPGAKQGWAFGQGASRLPNTRGNPWGTNTAVVNSLNLFSSIFGTQKIFGSDVPFNLYLTINALSQNTRTETLAAPKVMTTSGNKASVRMVKSYWFPEDWDTYELENDNGTFTITVPTPSFSDQTDIGITFDVTPVVNPDNYTISLEVNPSVTSYLGQDNYPIVVEGVRTQYVMAPDPITGVLGPQLKNIKTSTSFNVWMPIISRRNLRVNVTVYDGETIVLGGMIDSTTNTRTDKWPLLGDLPFIGRFFSSQAEDITRNNLLLFVTTRLVNNDGIPIRRNQQIGAPDFNR